MHYPSLIANTLQVVSNSKHSRSSAISDMKNAIRRSKPLPRTPSPSPSSFSSGSSSSRGKRRLETVSPPDSPKPSMRSESSQSVRGRSGRGGRYEEEQSYLSFDDDSDTDHDELAELSDWAYVEVNGRPFPMPRMSLPPRYSQRHDSFMTLMPTSTVPTRTPTPPRMSPPPPYDLPPLPDMQLMDELSSKELEPIVPLMEPGIFADDGAQGDWRQMVDIFIRDDRLGL